MPGTWCILAALESFITQTRLVFSEKVSPILSRLLNKCQTFVFVSHFINVEFHKTLKTAIYHRITLNWESPFFS